MSLYFQLNISAHGPSAVVSALQHKIENNAGQDGIDFEFFTGSVGRCEHNAAIHTFTSFNQVLAPRPKYPLTIIGMGLWPQANDTSELTLEFTSEQFPTSDIESLSASFPNLTFACSLRMCDTTSEKISFHTSAACNGGTWSNSRTFPSH